MRKYSMIDLLRFRTFAEENQNMPVFRFTGVFWKSKKRQYLLFLANNEVAF